MVRNPSSRQRTGQTPRGAVKSKPSAGGPSGRTAVPSSARISQGVSRTPPLLPSPRLAPANGGRLVASEPTPTVSSADPLTAYPRSGTLYDSPSSFLNGTSTGNSDPVAPASRPAGGDYVVFSNSGKHMIRRTAGQQSGPSDSVAALLHGTGGAGLSTTLLGSRRLSLGQGTTGIDRAEGTSSALTRLPAGAGKTSGRPAHPASGPPTTVSRQNLLLSRRGRRSQEHLAPLLREDLSLDPRKEAQRHLQNGGASSWGDWASASIGTRQRAQESAGFTGDGGGGGVSGLAGAGDEYGAGPASAASISPTSGSRSPQLFSSLRYYTSQRLAQDQQSAAEYEAGVLGGDGSRAFALSGGVGTPSSAAATAAAARSRRFSLGTSSRNPAGHNGSPSLNGPTAGSDIGSTPFLGPSPVNDTRGSGGAAFGSSPRRAGAGDSPTADLAAHAARMPRDFVHFGTRTPPGARDGGGGPGTEEPSLSAGAGVHRTIHPGDDTDHFFAPDGDDEDYFEDPATEAQLLQQAFERDAASAQDPSSRSNRSGVKGAKKATSSPGKGKTKGGDGGSAQPYDFRVVLSSGKTVSRPVALTVGSGCVQGLRPTMEDEHTAQLNIMTVREQPLSVVAILDGHCGRRVAELGAKYVPELICQHDALGENTALAIVESIVQADQSIYKVCCGPPSPQQKSARNKLMSTQRQDFTRSLGGGGGGLNHNESGGSTLIAAVVLGRMLYVACLGDARAVLYDGRTTIAMSEDHKPNSAKEMKRINHCGGFVQFGRVCGVLAVSRALGDYEFKEQAATGSGGGKLHFRNDKELMVSNVADVRQLHLTDESKFLLLACDGLWDVISNEEATQFVRDFLLYTPEMSDPAMTSGQKPRPSAATVERVLNNCCRKLAEFAVSSGSTDNVSVTVLFFHDVVDVVASFRQGAAAATAAAAAAPPSGRRTSLFAAPRTPQSSRQQQQQDVIDNILFAGSRGARSGSDTATTTTLTNGRPTRPTGGGGGSHHTRAGAAPSSALDQIFGSSFGRRANMSASRGVENTFGSGSRGLW